MSLRDAPLTRLYLDVDLSPEQEILLEGPQHHQIKDVLRAQVGEVFLAFNGRDGEWMIEITALDKKKLTGLPRIRTRKQIKSDDSLWLIFSALKRNPTDLIIQKATELGVSQILPIVTERSNTERINAERFEKIAVEASEQCARLDIPKIGSLEKLQTIVENWPSNRALIFCAEAGDAKPIAAVCLGLSTEQAGILIGPEGGFSHDEIDYLQSKGFVHSASLGPRILRAETASMAAISVYQALAGDGDDERAHFGMR